MVGPSQPLDLPLVSYSLLPSHLHTPQTTDNPQFIQFGYNPPHQQEHSQQAIQSTRYLRWVQPLEKELSKQVEYDMDQQDKVWLDSFNTDRKKEAIQPISYEVFEVIMDKIEKEWFDLTKSIPKKSNALPSENDKCSICDDGECENSNAIVFCDGCNLAVHQDCYGVPYIPEGQWLCRKCTVSPDKPVNCVFCPQMYGAFKQTTTGHWGHLLCAIWIPETGVSNTVYMEPIDGVENIPKSRWKLNCYLCKKKLGACIQCSNRNCYTAYHVTCAREFGLEVRMKQAGSNGVGTGGELKSWCDKHGKVQLEAFANSRAATPLPPSSTRIPSYASPLASTSTTSLSSYPSPLAPHNPNPSLLKVTLKPPPPLPTRSSLAYKKSLSLSKQIPLIPHFVFERVLAYVGNVKGVTKKKEVVGMICRYWSLKREGRRGAPLLKRIHLEPWTASASSRLQSDSDRAAKLELIKLLREDLERVRNLTEQVRLREKKKLERIEWFEREVLDGFVWSKQTRLKMTLKEIISLDKSQYYLNPVDKSLVPDYHEIIKSPMDWTTMGTKLDRHEYESAQDFRGDVELVLNNARRYNKPYLPIHKNAIKLLETLQPLFESLEREIDDPTSSTCTRESLAPRLLLEEGGVRMGEDVEMDEVVQEEGRVVVEELERVWFNSNGKSAEGIREEREEVIRKKREEEERKVREEEEIVKKLEEEEQRRVEQEKQKEEEKLEKERLEREVEAKKKAATGGKGKKRDVEAAGFEDETEQGTGQEDSKFKKGKSEPAAAKKVKTQNKDKVNPVVVVPEPRIEQVTKLEVEDVSSRDTFKLFETGWVLPEGSSRRKPATPNVPPIPLPSAPTPAPVASTSKATPSSTPAIVAAPRTTTKSTPAPSASKPPVSSRKGKEKATPAPPDPEAKLLKPKTKRQITQPPEPPKQTDPIPFEREVAGRNPAQQVRDWQTSLASWNSVVAINDDTDVSDGILVWHRSAGAPHPFYPAEIADPKGSDMPKGLLAARPKTVVERIPILYFDEKRSGAWALRSEMRLLGESKEFDELLLSEIAVQHALRKKKSTSRKPNSQHLIEIKEAYEFAMSNVELPGEGEEEEEQEKGKKVQTKGRKKKATARKGRK